MRVIIFCTLTAAIQLGCATAKSSGDDWAATSESQPSENAPPKGGASLPGAPGTAAATLAPGAPFDAKAFAANYPVAAGCEAAARSLQAQNRDYAWAALNACAARDNFTILQKVLTDAWEDELKTRKDALPLLAKLIAKRGGGIERDVSLIQTLRVPLFSLSAAMAQPDVYKGRFIVVRGKVSDIRAEKGKTTVTIDEMGLAGETKEVQVGSKSNYQSNYSGSGNANWKSTNYGSGKVSGDYSSSGGSSYTKTEQKHDNMSVETGRQALGKLAKPDPFLQPDKEFVMLAKFEGVRKTSSGEADDDEGDDEPESKAVLTIFAYYVPSPLVVY